MITIFFLLNFFSCCQNKLFHFFPNCDDILRSKITLVKDHIWWCSIYGSCFCRRFPLYPFLVLLVLCHILCSLKENVLGSLSLCKLNILGRFQCQFCFCDPSALSVLFSVLQFYKFLFRKYFLVVRPLVLTSYEIC